MNYEGALDSRENELKKQGYVNLKDKKAYVRIGRSIFIVESIPIITDKWIFGFPPEGYLRILVEGDPDAGLGRCTSEILLTGYRFGLDDVIIDGKIFKTVHGDENLLIETLISELELTLKCRAFTFSNHTKQAKKYLNYAKELIENSFAKIREAFEIIKHYEDQTEEV